MLQSFASIGCFNLVGYHIKPLSSHLPECWSQCSVGEHCTKSLQLLHLEDAISHVGLGSWQSEFLEQPKKYISLIQWSGKNCPCFLYIWIMDDGSHKNRFKIFNLQKLFDLSHLCCVDFSIFSGVVLWKNGHKYLQTHPTCKSLGWFGKFRIFATRWRFSKLKKKWLRKWSLKLQTPPSKSWQNSLLTICIHWSS